MCKRARMGIARMRQQCIPGRFFLPRKKWPGNEATWKHTINPRRACAARVRSVCLLSHISPMERPFVLKTLSRTQRATKVKNLWDFRKPLRCRDPALPPLYGHAYSRPFFHAYFSCTRISRVRACVFLVSHDTPPRVQHFSVNEYS